MSTQGDSRGRGNDKTNAPAVTRRTLLRGSIGGLGAMAIGGSVLAACGSGGETRSEGVSRGPQYNLAALFPRNAPHLAPERATRMPFTVADAEGIPLKDIATPLTFRFSFDGEPVGEPIEASPRGDGVPRPYLPVEFTFPRPGLYDINTVYEGVELNTQVQVLPAEDVPTPMVGDELPPADTPTLDRTFEVDPICTRVPTCPFHTHGLTEALATDRPVVVLLATPAYCRTTACGPILDLLVDVAEGRDDLIVIHSEVYKNPKDVNDLNDATLAPLPETYGIPFEPCLFVTDSSHRIVARGDVVVDRGEMSEMLELAV